MRLQITSTRQYEFKEKLGGGLTSEVYRAVRKDPDGLFEQNVALKVLNSKKDIQIFKLEFEKLLKIHSKYCVKILGWETVNDKRALVLEYVSGRTLNELLLNWTLTQDEKKEILFQVASGLLDLHGSKLCHGDLNLHNIMINEEGIVKLIDFGDEDPETGGQFLTSGFASPRRQRGQSTTYEDDLFSFHRISEFILGFVVQFEDLPQTSARHRRSLGKKIKKWPKKHQTEVVVKGAPQTKKSLGPKILSTLCFLYTLLFYGVSFSEPLVGAVTLQSNAWFQYSINELPLQYGPISLKKLRVGRYNLKISNDKGSFERDFNVEDSQIFLLQPNLKNLK